MIGGNDATPDVRKVSVTIGRPNELDQFPPGSLTATLNNRHRKWEPFINTGYLPTPGMQAQLTATVGSTNYPLFNGRATGFPQQWAADGADAYVPFTALDELSKLAKLKLRGSTFDVLRASNAQPVAWYTFDKDGAPAGASDDATIADSVAANNGVARGVVDWNQPSLLGSKLGASVNLPAGGWLILPPSVGQYVSTFDTWNVSFLYRRANNIDLAGETIVHVGNGAGASWRILHNAAGKIEFQAPNGTTLQSTNRVGTGVTVFISAVRAGDVFWLYINGVQQASDTWLGDATANSPILVGTNPGQGAFTEATYADCFIDEFLVFSASIDPGPISDGMLDGWAGDRTGERITRVIGLLQDGLGSAFLGDVSKVEAGNSVLAADGWEEGASALEVIQKIAATEQGRFFIDGNGDFVFHSRWRDARTADPLIPPLFSDLPSDVDNTLYIANGFGFDYDDRYIINRAQISTPHLTGKIEASDATSILDYTETTKPVDTLSRDKNEATAYAQSLIRKYKDPVLRVKEFSFNPQRQGSWDLALQLGPGSIVNLTREPRTNGVLEVQNIAGTYVVERVKHDIDCMKGIWVTTVFAVQFDDLPHWVLGTSTLGVDTTLVF